ncbi:hypothetical protein ACIRPX_36570 [Streptomyces sp. NPDC101225]|uniref:hypothetical protein n=1 Tax=Streptomyces sp. NPDC101225 TaxID=3366135 RepID=UPI00381EF412
MLFVDMVIFLVGSVLQFYVSDGLQPFLIRLLMGVAIGGEYPLAPRCSWSTHPAGVGGGSWPASRSAGTSAMTSPPWWAPCSQASTEAGAGGWR